MKFIFFSLQFLRIVICVGATFTCHMPALQMKAKSNEGCLKKGSVLHACCSLTKIPKRPRLQVRMAQQAAMLDSFNQKHEDAAAVEVSRQHSDSSEDLDHQDLLARATCQLQNPDLSSVDSSYVGRLETLPDACPSVLETIFSPIFEQYEVHCDLITHDVAVANDEQCTLHGASDDSDDGSCSSSDYPTCNVSDFHISDMSIASFSFDDSAGLHDKITTNTHSECLGFECPDVMIDMADRYMVLPFLEESTETCNLPESELVEEAIMDSNDACVYLEIHQTRPSDQESGIIAHCGNLHEVDNFNPYLFIRNIPDLSEMVPSLPPMLLPKEARKSKLVTLVLDLDETLVHSTLDHCDNADFTFSVYLNMKEHTVYVRQRPYLQLFLERVAEMFEVIVFTASQSIYAEQLLDILDRERKRISQRVYRESCVFSDGVYTKDLTVLGLDLAKVAIIDNSPQVFRFQVNNGIPIKSWFDDPSDSALVSLLPFLETLVDADDVRPIIAKQFGNKE